MKKENYHLIEWVSGAIAGACFLLFNTIASSAGIFSPDHIASTMTKTIALLFLAASIVIAISLMVTGRVYKTKENPEELFKKYESFFDTSLFAGYFSAVLALILMLTGFFYGNNLDIKQASLIPVGAFFTVILVGITPLFISRIKSKEKNQKYTIAVKDQSSGDYSVSVKED